MLRMGMRNLLVAALRREKIDLRADPALILLWIDDHQGKATQRVLEQIYPLPANISYNVAQLEDAGFLRRSGSQDKREVVLTVSRKGQRAVEIMITELERLDKEMALFSYELEPLEAIDRLLQSLLTGPRRL